MLDPLQHLALARQRQSYVIDRLVATGVLTRAQAAAAAAAPLDLR
jgi:membrane carboxypeptidase/penicillin-binding protein